MSGCLYPIKVRSDPNFCGFSRNPKEGLWMIEFSKLFLQQKSIFDYFENPRNSFDKIRETFVSLIYNLYKEKMFTIEIKDERKA